MTLTRIVICCWMGFNGTVIGFQAGLDKMNQMSVNEHLRGFGKLCLRRFFGNLDC